MPETQADEAGRLRVMADRYFAQAAAARALAAEIDARRAVLTTRLDPCVQRHLPETWSSNAAEISRMQLTRMVARDVWVACEQLLATRTALISAAEAADSHAFALQSRAAGIEYELSTNQNATPNPVA